MVEKALVIKGPVGDLYDILRIARVEGRKTLGVKKVVVKPVVVPYGDGDYLVVVEPDGSGCSEESVVGCGKAKGK